MKKIILIIIFMLFLNGMSFSQVYYNISLKEGLLYTGNDLIFINDIVSDLAYIFPFSDNHSIIGFYQIKYSGPGIGNSAETKFSERSQDHYFMLKYLMKLNKDLKIKPSVSFLKEFFKFAKNENWGEGLYDLNRYDAGVDIVYSGLLKTPVTLTYKYQFYQYPNYNDLLTLYLTSFQDNKEIENYNNHLISLSMNSIQVLKSLLISFGYDLNLSFYDNKKILSEEGYTGNKYQKSDNHIITFLPQYQTGSAVIQLGFQYELNNSTQNYIDASSTTNISVINNYYSYNSFNIRPGVSFNLAKKRYLSIMLAYINKKYASRPPQDKNSIFIVDSLMNTSSISAGISYYSKIGKNFSWSPSYTFILSDSNQKYQQSTVYNYNAHLLSLGLNYEY